MVKHSNICMMRTSEGGENEKQAERIFEKNDGQIILKLEKRYESIQRSKMNYKKDKRQWPC